MKIMSDLIECFFLYSAYWLSICWGLGRLIREASFWHDLKLGILFSAVMLWKLWACTYRIIFFMKIWREERHEKILNIKFPVYEKKYFLVRVLEPRNTDLTVTLKTPPTFVWKLIWMFFQPSECSERTTNSREPVLREEMASDIQPNLWILSWQR